MSVTFTAEKFNLPSSEATKQLTRSCLGFAGAYAKNYLKTHTPKSPTIANSLSTRFMKGKDMVWVKSWVEQGLWGAVGRALAKRPWIQSKILTQEAAIRTFGVTKKIRNLTQQRTTYKDGQVISRRNEFLREFDKVRVKIGTRVNSKGKVVPRYKTTYQVKGGYNQGINTTGLLKFIGKDGQWKSTYGFKLASRPESLQWDNWMVREWEMGERSAGFATAMNTHYAKKLEEALAAVNPE